MRWECAGGYLLGLGVCGPMADFPTWVIVGFLAAGVGLIEWARHDEGKRDA
ncbi:hypothetical protein KDJ57_gp33 [Gordonia phage Catfish]|uniref:Uncharacterized protein n=1 Tax=Gordonia phage Catfish TaxID=2301538 RepID=A0A385D0N2_9CAUD|nr:hypothetical protein KDJ57_gp33 [Gordonia phage Catfish]AXQ51912.1 hypothetical protein SEA_CATFISH_76 [Gordonia phage Catfish]